MGTVQNAPDAVARLARVTRAFGIGAAVVGGSLVAGAAAAHRWWRPRCVDWGARPEEVLAELPGDEFLEAPHLVTTRAIGIHAPPDAVWPWLVQLGPDRGGVYTYDWIENLLGLHVHSVDEVVPEFQHLEVGDAQKLGASGPVLRVARIDPGEAIVLRSDDGDWVWAFVVATDGPTTRLISRNRIDLSGQPPLGRWLITYGMVPASLIMERKMLLGIKERAERRDAVRPSRAIAA